jgi:heavy-metal-associated domain-containing protein
MERAMPPARCVHALPGRLRVKVASIRKSPAAAAAVERALCQQWGVAGAVANPVTGSVLIRYDAERISPQAILACVGYNNFPSAAAPASSAASGFSYHLALMLVRLVLAEMLSLGPAEILFALIREIAN